MPDGTQRLSDDLVVGIHDVVTELYGEDNEQNRRRIYRMRSEVAPGKRLPGLISVGGKVALVRSIAREGLARQAAINIAEKEEVSGGNPSEKKSVR